MAYKMHANGNKFKTDWHNEQEVRTLTKPLGSSYIFLGLTDS